MDPLTIGTVAGGIASLGAGSLGMLGGLFSNSANAEENHKNRKLALLMSKKQMQWRVADLRKAGLNPVLAANSGLSAGGGHVPSSIPMQNPASGADSIAETLGKLSSDYVKASQTADQIKLNEQAVSSQSALNEATAKQQDSQSLLNVAKTQSVIDENKRKGEMHSPNMRLVEAQVKAMQTSSALGEQQRKTEEARTIIAQAEADYADMFQSVRLLYSQEQLRNMNVDTELKRNQISVSNANLALAKIQMNLSKIRTESDLEETMAKIHLLYRKAYNASLESDLLRWQSGAKLPAAQEQFLTGASKISGLLSDVAPLLLMAHPATRAVGFGWQGLRWLGSVFRDRSVRAGFSRGKYGDRGGPHFHPFNGDPWYSNERHNW